MMYNKSGGGKNGKHRLNTWNKSTFLNSEGEVVGTIEEVCVHVCLN